MVTFAAASTGAQDSAAARRFMVDGQIRTNKVTDEGLIEALADLPREKFIDAGLRSRAYIDDDLPIGNGRYLMEPMVLARLVQSLQLEPGQKVLVVGSAGGYSAALLARLGASVTALESEPALVELARGAIASLPERSAVNVVSGALRDGHAQSGPFNAILLEGAVAEIPHRLLEQLKQGGRLATVMRNGDASVGRAVLLTRTDSGEMATRVLFDANTPMLAGFEAKPGFTF